MQQLVKLSEALTQAQLDAINAKALWDAANSVKDNAAKLHEVAETDPAKGAEAAAIAKEIEQYRAQISDTNVKLAGLQRNYPSSHPTIQNLRAYAEGLQTQIAAKDRQFAQALSQRARRCDRTRRARRWNLFRLEFEKAQKDSYGANVNALEYTRLELAQKRTERMFEVLDQRIRELDVSRDGSLPPVSILDEARPAGTPSYPRKSQALAIALVLGLLGGRRAGAGERPPGSASAFAGGCAGDGTRADPGRGAAHRQRAQHNGARPVDAERSAIGCGGGDPHDPHRGLLRRAGRPGEDPSDYVPCPRRREDGTGQQSGDRHGPRPGVARCSWTRTSASRRYTASSK